MISSIDIELKNQKKIKFLWKNLCNTNLEKSNFKIISLPYEIENRCDELKNRYLKFVSSKGFEKINGISLVDHFKINGDFSYWWMTEFQEKQHYGRNSPIYSVIKLMILDDFLSLEKNNILKITVNEIDQKYVSKIIKQWTSKNNIDFICDKSLNSFFLLNFLKKIYYVIKAFSFLLIYYLKNFNNKTVNIEKAFSISFWSYFINNNGAEIEKSGFRSQYWTELVCYLEKNDIQVNWMHIWLKSYTSYSINLRDAFHNFKLFRSNYPNSFHHIINGNFPLKLLLKVANEFLLLPNLISLIKNLSFKENFGELDYNFAYISMFKKDLYSSQGMLNIINFNHYDFLLSVLPHQKVGFYLQENNAWEIAFLHAWKKYNHGKIIGVAHATIRFWDLRYFSYDFDFSLNIFKPTPDIIAVNSNFSKNSLIPYTKGSIQIIELEALRYLYLNTQRKLPIVKQLKSKPILLILGDYDAINTENLLNLISLININTLHKFEILFKSHPGSEYQLKFDFKRFKFKIVNNPISELLIYSNIVCSTNSTSASVEAFCFGLDILIYNSYNNFNMSPLKDVDGVVFFENSKTLETLLINFFQNFPQISSKDRLYKDYFYINTDLSNWKKILNQYLD